MEKAFNVPLHPMWIYFTNGKAIAWFGVMDTITHPTRTFSQTNLDTTEITAEEHIVLITRLIVVLALHRIDAKSSLVAVFAACVLKGIIEAHNLLVFALGHAIDDLVRRQLHGIRRIQPLRLF